MTGFPNPPSDFLATIGGPIVLVGHSYGGSVITNAAAGHPNVKALVYVDAAAPDVGETTAHSAEPLGARPRPRGALFDPVPIPADPPERSAPLPEEGRVRSQFGTTFRKTCRPRLGQPAGRIHGRISTPIERRCVEDDSVLVLRRRRRGVITPASESAMAKRAPHRSPTSTGGIT